MRHGFGMKMLPLALLLLAALLLPGCALLRRPEADTLALLRDAALRADEEAGRRAEALRAARGEAALPFDELLLLARYIDARAGDARLTEEQRLCVGEVMLNRVASPEYPDTLADVLHEAGFAPGWLCPGAGSVDAALALLQGRRLLEPRVVIQTQDRPRGAVYASFCDRYARRTYFCLSEHPELYGEEGE